jgi:hypothetical protein
MVMGLAVDYAASTCRVAFDMPTARRGGFVEASHAKMELRFVAATKNVEEKFDIQRGLSPAGFTHGVVVPDSDDHLNEL